MPVIWGRRQAKILKIRNILKIGDSANGLTSFCKCFPVAILAYRLFWADSCGTHTAKLCLPLQKTNLREEIMRRFAFAILLISSPTLAQDRALDSNALRECSPIGQSAKGELIYGMDCKALKPENISTEYKPDMPRTDMKDTVIPKSGKTQTPETTPTTGANR